MKDRNTIQQELAQQFMDSGFKSIIYAAPRTGKIKITINCLKKTDKIVIAYPSVGIKKSWADDFIKWKFKPKNCKYTTYMSFKKLKESVDVLILDEIHTLSENQVNDVAAYIKKFDIKKVIGLSGTISTETELMLLEKLKLPITVRYSIAQAIEDKVISDYRIEVVTVPLRTIKDQEVVWNSPQGKKTFLVSEKGSFDRLTQKIAEMQFSTYVNYKQLKMLRLARVMIIKKSQAKVEATKKLLQQYKDKRILVFAGLTEIADKLGIPSYHSKKEDEVVKDNFLAGRLDKLAIVNKLGVGVTFSSLDTCIVNYFDSNAENMGQRISRITNFDYKNENKCAHIIIVSSNEQVELLWLQKALSFFSPEKIKYL
jgi:superfamily II DNA or RNA helicase